MLSDQKELLMDVINRVAEQARLLNPKTEPIPCKKCGKSFYLMYVCPSRSIDEVVDSLNEIIDSDEDGCIHEY